MFARYRMSDGMVVDCGNATAQWDEATQWDGNNHVGVSSGSQWSHQKLYRSRRGRYYLEHTSQWQGSTPSAEWVSNEEATRWLLLNDHEIPEELQELVDQVTD